MRLSIRSGARRADVYVKKKTCRREKIQGRSPVINLTGAAAAAAAERKRRREREEENARVSSVIPVCVRIHFLH